MRIGPPQVPDPAPREGIQFTAGIKKRLKRLEWILLGLRTIDRLVGSEACLLRLAPCSDAVGEFFAAVDRRRSIQHIPARLPQLRKQHA